MKLFHDTIQQLSTVYPQGEAKALARWVMEERFGLSMTDLMLDKDNELSSLQCQDLQNITERLLQKEPIQYILGETRFCGLTLHVAPGVLIPRPETQELVEWICQDYHAPQGHAPRMLDIGTGSGCIALSLASKGFQVEAWDISKEALEIAENNAKRLGLNVAFRQEDILQICNKNEIEADCSFDTTKRRIDATELRPDATECTLNTTGRTFDVIVSNPPYICESEAKDMDANVLEHEPHLALFVPNEDPLLFYRHIARYASQHLSEGGKLYFEINRALGEETCKMLTDMGFCDVTLRKDQFENPRMVRATWPCQTL